MDALYMMWQLVFGSMDILTIDIDNIVMASVSWCAKNGLGKLQLINVYQK